MADKLSAKQKKFCDEYVVDLDAVKTNSEGKRIDETW